MVYCYRKASNVQSNIINLSQLDYRKSTCPANLEHTCNLCQELHTLEKDIEKAIAGLKQLLNRHQNVKTEINRTHSPIIRDLPVEILSKIFYSCFSEEMRKVEGEPKDGDHLVPLKVGAVCRTWRQIAWSSPELWTVMYFRRHFPSASYACLQYAIMKEWISRSGALPVYVTLHEQTMEDVPVGRRMVAIGCRCWELSLDLLARCSDRWKDVDLDLSRASFEYIARRLKLKPPTRKLALASAEEWDRINGTEVLKLWQDSEFSTQNLTINRPVRLQHISIDWKHVTHVESYAWLPKDCASLLRHAPQLVSCFFYEVGDASIEFPDLDGPPICHTSLRHLFLDCEVPAAPFFDCISLPFLEELVYSNDNENGMTDTFLTSFFSRSSFPLQKLSLDAYTFTPEYLVAVLDLVPSLVHLELTFSNSRTHELEDIALMGYLLSHLATTAALSSNTGSGASDEFLPRLEVLRVHDWLCQEFPWTFVPRVFGFDSETGKSGQRPFKSITITTYSLPPAPMLPGDVVNSLVSLRQAGIELGYRVSSAGLKFVRASWEAI